MNVAKLVTLSTQQRLENMSFLNLLLCISTVGIMSSVCSVLDIEGECGCSRRSAV